MTNAELIAKIKAEIERLLNEAPTFDDTIAYLTEVECFLDTLESEKPMQEGLEEEIKKEMANLPFFLRGKDQIAFARHFAQWGAEQTPDPDDETQVEYIRKDALIEWANKELEMRRNTGDDYFYPAIVVLDGLIDKLNSL